MRSYLAKLQGVPPYVIFSDATLQEMCRRLPTTYEQLEKVQGVGEVKLKKYGESFINAIIEYLTSKNIRKAAPNDAEDGEETTEPIRRKKTLPIRAGVKWTAEEDSEVAEEFNDGKKMSQIAKDHGRSNGSIRSRLIKLGLIEEQAE